jgi:hypothetical protein
VVEGKAYVRAAECILNIEDMLEELERREFKVRRQEDKTEPVRN